MIQQKEVKLGNFLQCGDEILIVSAIYRSGFHCVNESGVDRDNHRFLLKPIPLTEQWLLKFGLSNRKIWVFEIFGDNHRGFHISSEGGEWLFIKYVHQLQNLYFALTGEELKVKEMA